MKLAIQADMLPGRTIAEQIKLAKSLGFAGVDLWADAIDTHLIEIATALDETGLEVASIHLGQMDGYLSTDLAVRESAIGHMRESMATAVDLFCDNVVFVPQWGDLITPDLTPLRSAEELSSDLMIWLLRTVSDLAYALGTTLHMQPRHRYHTQFLNTIAQAVTFSDAIKDSEYVRIAPNLFDMALEEADPLATVATYSQRIGYLYLADSNGKLPGQGLYDWGQVAQTLQSSSYDGWLCLSAGDVVNSPTEQYKIYDGLSDSLALLRRIGLFR